MDEVQGELLRGNIDTIILKCLFDGDKYGNEIMKDIEERTKGQFVIKQPTLYSSLTRLENQGLVSCKWVSGVNSGRRKYISMTASGRAYFEQKQREWEFSRSVVDKLISEQIFDLNAREVTYEKNNEDVQVQPIQSDDADELRGEEADDRQSESTATAEPIAEEEIDVKTIDAETADTSEFDYCADAFDAFRNEYATGASYSDALQSATMPSESEQLTPEPPQFVVYESDERPSTEINFTFTEETVPVQESEPSPEELAMRDHARTKLFSEKNEAVIPQKEEPIKEADNYRAVLTSLFRPASLPTETVSEPLTVAPVEPKDTLPGGIAVRRHNRDISKEYNEKYYIYSSKLRLSQYLILAAVMIVESLALYLSFTVGAHITRDAWLYFTCIGIAAAFPVLAAATYFMSPTQTARIPEHNKNTVLYRFLITLECIIVIVCINILADKNVLTAVDYLPRIILPCLLVTNFMVDALINKMLIKSGRFAVKQ